MKKSNSVTVPEVERHLQGTKISTGDVALIMEELAIEENWDWTKFKMGHIENIDCPHPHYQNQKEKCVLRALDVL